MYTYSYRSKSIMYVERMYVYGANIQNYYLFQWEN